MTRRPIVRVLLLALLALLPAACVAATSPAPSADPSPTSSASPGPSAPLIGAQLRIRLIDRFGPLWYCDPDFWPIAREDEQALALQRWPEVSSDTAAVAAIRAHLGISLTATLTEAQKLAIYREWKVLRAISLEPDGAERFSYDYLAMPPTGVQEGTRSEGTIDRFGAIAVTSATPAPEPACPICLGRGQLIDSPAGGVPVETLRLGDPVWTLDAAGRRVAGEVIALGSTPAPGGHEMVRIVLADGRSLLASPGHPLADGRRLGGLRPGDQVGGATILVADRIPYGVSETFDVLPSGPTGRYSIDGIWLLSTLSPWPAAGLEAG